MTAPYAEEAQALRTKLIHVLNSSPRQSTAWDDCEAVLYQALHAAHQRGAEQSRKAQQNILDAIEYTLSSHGCEDWLREWVEGAPAQERELSEWVSSGRPK